MNALQTFNEILQHADLIASAILQQTNPKRDLISQRKAFQEYGADLIKRGEEAGMLKPIRTNTLLTQRDYRADKDRGHHAQRGLRDTRNTKRVRL